MWFEAQQHQGCTAQLHLIVQPGKPEMAQHSIEPGVARQGAADVGVVVPVVRLLLRQRIRRAGQLGKIDDLAAFTPLYGKLLIQPLQNPKIAKKRKQPLGLLSFFRIGGESNPERV